ncbi:MAG: hypothetical protein FWG10_09505 [Eubacteriaceae bacterium]|nr:hypothetical protein [Eubacteriaceae bacterium]
MDSFRAAVKDGMSSGLRVSAPQGAQTPPQEGEPVFNPYLVRVTANPMDIHSGPGSDSAIVGKISDKGIYTIAAESTGTGSSKWGKLISGSGWICLDLVKKL